MVDMLVPVLEAYFCIKGGTEYATMSWYHTKLIYFIYFLQPTRHWLDSLDLICVLRQFFIQCIPEKPRGYTPLVLQGEWVAIKD